MNEPQNNPVPPQDPYVPQQTQMPSELGQPYMPAEPVQPYMPVEAASSGAEAGYSAPAYQQPYAPVEPAQPQMPAQPYMPADQYGCAQQPYAAQDPYGYAQQPYGVQDPYGYAAVPPKNGKATAAAVCGVISILLGLSMAGALFGLILGIVAIVLASGAVKQMGMKNGASKTGKICGIIGSIISALALLLTLIIGCVGVLAFNELSNISEEDLNSLVFELDEMLEGEGIDAGLSGLIESTENATPVPAPGTSAPLDNAYFLGEGAEDAGVVAAARFDLLLNGSVSELQTIAAMADEDMVEQMGCTFADLGLDPMEYARWITEGFAYSVDMVEADKSTGTATAYVNAYPRDVFALLDNFDVALGKFMETDEYANTSDAAALYAAVGGVFKDAMADTANAAPMENYAIIGLTLENGTWVINEEDWLFELDYMFGLA